MSQRCSHRLLFGFGILVLTYTVPTLLGRGEARSLDVCCEATEHCPERMVCQLQGERCSSELEGHCIPIPPDN
jgi:hypothetical protein